ncbi:8-oxoguanine deaminase [Mycolicibacterium mengxianglii]|uniref:8-oxoguanine deaminase n=1 Tax=Mycolicibacterium mengxianglii TaxID=2736649 RepID=UPI0018EEFEC7|nr:8-oxoguanine deaminase [Mycolicibacterium mengxianglii]
MPIQVFMNAAVATVDQSGTEYRSGYIVVRDGVIATLGEGRAPQIPDAEMIDGRGCLATPGLVNTHHHMNQWITRGHSQDGTLFQWLTTLYPLWAAIDEELEFASASAALGMLALTGCTTTMDHHYVFPRGGGDVLAAEVAAAARIGLRFHPTRGSMDLGASSGGLPPDSVVEDIDTILGACADAVDTHHDPAFDSRCRIALAPCSPFSVTGDLMRRSAELARELGVRLHTHLAETVDEEDFCLAHFGARPADYVESLGWLGEDVWLAHCVHLSDGDITKFAASGTSVAHCPSSNGRLGAGIAPIPELLAAGVPVGLGVDGVASNEHGGLGTELRGALLAARLRLGPQALTARQCLQMATMGGARCLGRDRELGSLEVGKLADIALWDLTGLGHADIDDPVCALVFGPPAPLRRLLVGGQTVVSAGELRTADAGALATHARAAARSLRERAGY